MWGILWVLRSLVEDWDSSRAMALSKRPNTRPPWIWKVWRESLAKWIRSMAPVWKSRTPHQTKITGSSFPWANLTTLALYNQAVREPIPKFSLWRLNRMRRWTFLISNKKCRCHQKWASGRWKWIMMWNRLRKYLLLGHLATGSWNKTNTLKKMIWSEILKIKEILFSKWAMSRNIIKLKIMTGGDLNNRMKRIRKLLVLPRC